VSILQILSMMVRGNYVLNQGQAVASVVVKKELYLRDSRVDVSVNEDQSHICDIYVNFINICNIKFIMLVLRKGLGYNSYSSILVD